MNPQKMMGYEIPGDQKVPVPVRDWNALKLAIWRGKVAWGIAMHQATEILDRCRHTAECPGVGDENAPCVAHRHAARADGTSVRISEGCPDRELRMSALVILNAGKPFAATLAHKPADAPYFAPSREYFSEVLAALVAAETEIEALRAKAGPDGRDGLGVQKMNPVLAAPSTQLTLETP
jgi:hypothetical protein